MPSLATLQHQLKIASHILHVAHTGKHPVSNKEDMLAVDMYKKNPHLVRQAEENVVALQLAIRDKEKASLAKRTRKGKAGRRTRRARR